MANMDRVNATFDKIANDLDKWRQHNWAYVNHNHPRPENNWCGARFCMAGQGSIDAGFYPVVVINKPYFRDVTDPVESMMALFTEEFILIDEREPGYSDKIDAAHEIGRHPMGLAQEYFEMTEAEAKAIFTKLGGEFTEDEFDEFRAYATLLLTDPDYALEPEGEFDEYNYITEEPSHNYKMMSAAYDAVFDVETTDA